MSFLKNVFKSPSEKKYLEHVSLYMFPTCPFCVKVMVYIKTKQLSIKQYNIRKDESAYKELLEGGGKKQVPCLKIEEQPGSVRWLYESDDIIEYLSKQLNTTDSNS